MGINRGILSLLVIGILTMSLAAATHSSSADLQPEWSPAGQLTAYQVEISNGAGSDAIDEVRVYNNALYSDFACEQNTGWNLVEIPNFEDGMCFYFTSNSSNNIEASSSEIFEFEATVPQLGCELEWKFETRDEASTTSGDWNTIFDTTSVDNLPPEITKMVTGAQSGFCPPAPNSNEVCWITQDTVIEVWVEEPDESICSPPSGVDYCDFTVLLDGELLDEWTVQGDDGAVHTEIQWDEDSQHTLTIECYDRAGNSVSDTEQFRVDDTAPETEHEFNNSVHVEDGITWIDSVTTITLTSEDPDPTGFSCNIGVNNTYYRVTLLEDEACEQARICQSSEGDGQFLPYMGPLSDIDESCHLIEYYSVDHLGNEEPVQNVCFFVDKTSPAVEKTMGDGPQAGTCPPEPGEIDSLCYVTSETDIHLNCEDQEPHPSGNEVISWRYRTSEDGQTWSAYNPDNTACEGTLVGDWCEQQTTDLDVSFPEASLHEMEWYCRDAVNKQTDVDLEYFRVDNEAPEIIKTLEGPWVGECPPEPGSDDVCYIKAGETQIHVNVTDGTSIHASNNVQCTWRYFWQGAWYPNEDGVQFGEENTTIVLDEDSTHTLEIICTDLVGNEAEDTEVFLVDGLAPETEKIIGEPFLRDWFPKGCEGLECGLELSEFITTETNISMSAYDAKVGVNRTYWRNLYIPDNEWGEAVCGHQPLRAVLVDDLDVNAQWNTPMSHCDPAIYMQYVDNPNEPWTEYVLPFTKDEESCHIVEYYSVDHLGNEEMLNWNCLFVDETEPAVNKTVGEPQYSNGTHLFVTQNTPITLSCYDQEPHPADHVMLHWRTRFAEDCADLGQANWSDWEWILNEGNDYLLEANITFSEDSCHELEYYCEDGLGNAAPSQFEIDVVETVPPVTTETILGPHYVVEGDEDCYLNDAELTSDSLIKCQSTHEYIDGVTTIQLEAMDPDPHPSGVNATYYRWSLLEDYVCYDPEWYCEPSPQPVMTQQACSGWACLDNSDEDFFVTGRYGNQVSPAQTWELAIWEIDGGENVVVDAGHAWTSGVAQDFTLTYDPVTGLVNFTVDGDSITWTFETGQAFEYIIPFAKGNGNGNSVTLSNMMLNGESVNDVTTPGAYAGVRVNLPDESQTEGFVLSGKATLTWTGSPVNEIPGFSVYVADAHDNEATPWMTYDQPFGIDEESCHLVEWYSVDNLGNTEETGYRCMFVDKTPPVTEETFGEPYFTEDGIEWINNTTEVSLEAYDPEPHPSGVNYTWYRWQLADDENCRNESVCSEAQITSDWIEYNGSFVIPEESCHVIEFYSVDNVEKTEEVNRVCTFVDTSAPTPNKTVGEPHGLWDGNGAFYQLQDQCNVDGGIDCWTVTTLTPISMQCVDPEPHPVGNSRVCFQVIYDPTPFDDGDITESYCEDGDINDEGYCCVDNEIDDFLFGEVSEHNLSFYCEDALGNRGELDSEMFKVDGTAFTIDINKKWNLISVPFKLLDDSLDDVFEGKEEIVQSVWSYDAVTGDWSVYTPDGNAANDEFDTMLPGWGYWLLSNADDELVIGGSLFQAGPNTPPSKTIVGGAWNLIGYYGKDGIDSYEGPAGAGDEALCHLNSIAASLWTQDFTGLFGYWEVDQPNPFFGIGQFDGLDPGAGYWMFSPEDGVYAKSTTCPGLPGLLPFI